MFTDKETEASKQQRCLAQNFWLPTIILSPQPLYHFCIIKLE